MASREDAKKRAGWTRVSRGQQLRGRVCRSGRIRRSATCHVKIPQRPLPGRAERSKSAFPPWPPPPRRPPGASAMSSARVVLGARCSPDARACRVSRTRARPVLARRASGSSHPPSSISSAPARRVVVVCKEVAAQTAAGLFSVSNLLQGRVDVWCRCVVAGLYLSDDVRADTAVSLVLVPPEETGAGLDRPSGGCRVVTVAGDAVEGLAPAEARVAILLQRALQHASLERLPELGRAGTGTRTGTRRDGDENGDGDGDGDEDGDGERGLRRNKSERNAARAARDGSRNNRGAVDPCPGSKSATIRVSPRRYERSSRGGRTCWTSTARRANGARGGGWRRRRRRRDRRGRQRRARTGSAPR